jgi:hypothetical protein
MFVLDAMQDDIEDLASIMRYLSEWRSHWPDGVQEDAVVEALKSLTDERLVEVYDESSDSAELRPVDWPSTDEAALRRYWFRPTATGRQMWNEWDAPSLPEQ